MALLQTDEEKTAAVPFKEERLEASLGISGKIDSFRNTTAYLEVDFEIYKQWAAEDLMVNGMVSLDFDDSRTVSNARPGSLSTIVYRDHFNHEWSFYANFFASNDDEDLEITAASSVGAGLNLWRGRTPQEFLDLQMGIGPRYEYNFVDFEEQRNQVDPFLGLFLYGRGFDLGFASMDSLFYLTPNLTNFNHYIIGSDNALKIPISSRWNLTNRLFIRFHNNPINEETPKPQWRTQVGER